MYDENGYLVPSRWEALKDSWLGAIVNGVVGVFDRARDRGGPDRRPLLGDRHRLRGPAPRRG